MSYIWTSKYINRGDNHIFTLQLELASIHDVEDMLLHSENKLLGYQLKSKFLQALLDG